MDLWKVIDLGEGNYGKLRSHYADQSCYISVCRTGESQFTNSAKAITELLCLCSLEVDYCLLVELQFLRWCIFKRQCVGPGWTWPLFNWWPRRDLNLLPEGDIGQWRLSGKGIQGRGKELRTNMYIHQVLLADHKTEKGAPSKVIGSISTVATAKIQVSDCVISQEVCIFSMLWMIVDLQTNTNIFPMKKYNLWTWWKSWPIMTIFSANTFLVRSA